MPIALRSDFDAEMVRVAAKRSKDGPQARRLLALAAIYEGGLPQRGGQDRRRDAPDRSRLGSQVQRSRAGRLDRSKAARTSASAERYASGCAGRDHRERSDPGRSRRRSLANRRSLPVGMGRIPCRRRQADVEPRAARHGLPQALGSPSPSCASRRRHRGF